ncbi:MAG: rod shape-determining protein RodA [Candidatus Nealsonbacteria bacterium]|nr:rod shape-determining protein RodA [Candidatus Nealsonbacteria bacterium]
MLNYFRKMDWIMIGAACFLTVFGLLSIYSSSSRGNDFLNFKKQIAFFIVGFSLMLIFAYIDWREIRDNPYLILIFYIICVVALAGLIILGHKIRGVSGWYKIGFITIDPIEYTKISLMLLLAKYFSNRHIEMYRLKHILLSGIYVAIPSSLIILQPNLGSALTLIVLWFGILVISKIKLRHLIALIACALIISALGWFFVLHPYQKQRIVSFILPQLEPLGAGWNQNQSKIAIGSGGLLGLGFNNGSQNRYGFLPEPQTDFIYSAISEEYGFIGVSVLFALYLLIIWRLSKIAFSFQSNFPRLFVSGFIIILFTQFFINIGMNLGLLPVIGISLPFVSYGGSGLISFFISLGIIQSIKVQ